MWITPPIAATPTIRNPQPSVDNSEGAVDYLYAQPLIHRLSTTNPQGYPQSYPHDPAHRAGLESHPGANHQTPTPPQTPPTQKGPTHHTPTIPPATMGHMPWTTSDRRTRLPKNWNQLRKQTLQTTNGKCAGLATPGWGTGYWVDGPHGTPYAGPRWHHTNCTTHATDIDHIQRGDLNNPSNLQPLCHPCHASKTTAEVHAIHTRKTRMRTRPTPQHPCDFQRKKAKRNEKQKQNKTSEAQTETREREI